MPRSRDNRPNKYIQFFSANRGFGQIAIDFFIGQKAGFFPLFNQALNRILQTFFNRFFRLSVLP